MEPIGSQLASGQSEYLIVGLLILLAGATALFILVASHLIGPKQAGKVKHSTYESGMDPVGDTRRRFGVRFYLIAVLFLIFDVEIVLLYPWAVLFPRLHARPGDQHYGWAESLPEGYGPGFMLAAIGIFVGLLLVGLIYEWRRGVFKWN